MTLDETLGFDLVELAEETAHARVAVDERHLQPLGLVHGGVYAAIAESLASHATAHSVASRGLVALGMSNNTSFFRTIAKGTVLADAVRIHRGRTTWVWDVRLTDEDGRLCAASRVTVAVRPPGRSV